MSGDIANLPEIVKLAKDYKATILVDEAHGIGVLGDHGKGVTNYYNLEKEIDIYVGTFLQKSWAPSAVSFPPRRR